MVYKKDHTPWPSGIYPWGATMVQCKLNKICKLKYVMHHINRIKHINHMVISIDAEKALDKIEHPSKIGLEKCTST